MSLDFLCGKKVGPQRCLFLSPCGKHFCLCISCYFVWGYDQQDWHKINKEQGLQSVEASKCLHWAQLLVEMVADGHVTQVRRAMVQHTEMRVECSAWIALLRPVSLAQLFCMSFFVHRPSSCKNASGTAVLHLQSIYAYFVFAVWFFNVLHPWPFLFASVWCEDSQVFSNVIVPGIDLVCSPMAAQTIRKIERMTEDVIIVWTGIAPL